MNEIKDESETVEKLHENTVLYTAMVRMLRAMCQAELAKKKKRDELWQAQVTAQRVRVGEKVAALQEQAAERAEQAAQQAVWEAQQEAASTRQQADSDKAAVRQQMEQFTEQLQQMVQAQVGNFMQQVVQGQLPARV